MKKHGLTLKSKVGGDWVTPAERLFLYKKNLLSKFRLQLLHRRLKKCI